MASSASSPSSASTFPFGTVVVTSPSFSKESDTNGTSAASTAGDGGAGPLAHLASTLPPNVRVLGTSDPYGARCGSGGGTIAALDYADAASAAAAAAACEHANDGDACTRDTADDNAAAGPSSVLIVHAGGESSRCPTQMVLGKAWSSLPVASAAPSSSLTSAGDHSAPTPQNPTALLVSELSTLLRDLPRGSVVVAASDVLLGLPKGISFDFSTATTGRSRSSSSNTSNRSSPDSVIGLAVPAPLHTAKNHGVYVLEPYLEHVHDDDRLNLSEHDGDSGGGDDDDDCGGGDIDNGVDNGHSNGGNVCKKRRVMAASDDAQEGVGAGASSTDARQSNMLLPRTVTRFLQKPSPDLMKATNHCTFGDDLSYEGTGGDTNSTNSTRIVKHDGASPSGEMAQNTEQECAWIDTGVVVFLPEAAAQLRALARGALRCCTHRGLQAMYQEEEESGGSGSSTMKEYANSHTIKVELYTHLMLALSTSATADADAVASDAGMRQNEGLQAYLDEHTTSKISPALLTEIYSRLSILPFRAAAVPAGRFVHLGTTSELLEFLVCGSCSSEASVGGHASTIASRDKTRAAWEVDAGRRSLGHKIGLRGRFNSFCLGVEPGNDDNIILGSIIISSDPAQTGRIGSGTVVEHSSLRCPHLVIGNNCLVSGIRGTSTEPVVIPDGMCFQMMPLHPTWVSSAGDGMAKVDDSANMPDVNNGKDYVLMYLAVEDPIKDASRIYGLSIDRLLELTKLEESDLWDDSIESNNRMLWNARIHPVLRSECSLGYSSNLGLNLQPLRWITFLLSFCHKGREDCITLTKEAQASLDLWRALPRLSLSEVRNFADPESEFAFRVNVNNTGVADAKSHHLNAVQDIMFAREHLQTDFRYVVDLFASLKSVEGDVSDALSCLDSIVLTSMKDGDFDIAGRCFMVISGLLGDLAKKVLEYGLLPNGQKWQTQIDALRFSKHSGSNKRVDIAQRLITLRSQAFSSFSLCRNLLDFLSTNYEQAAFALTEVCVRSSAPASAATSSRRGCNLNNGDDDIDVTAPANSPLPAGTWAVATAPARIDLQGGWSDTPPISYEHGGAVAGLAVKVDGKRPLSARCRIVASARGITLKSEGRDLKTGELQGANDCTNAAASTTEKVVSKVSDLSDFRDPLSSCSLSKCALIFLGLVPLVEVAADNNEDLQPYINKFCQRGVDDDVGLEIVTTSLLPKGSGMGTSSILGGCVLASIERCVGTNVTGVESSDGDDNIVDAVLTLEQMLTTGGGWQDQVNGLIGGLKVGSSARAIPLCTSVSRIPLGQKALEALNQRILLAFTGQPRLAKNILVNVLRRWGRRTDEMTKTVEELVAGATKAADAAKESDIDEVGECLDRYWQLKKVMAGLDSGVEPRVVGDVLSTLKEKDAIVGGSLCGAGGGGFMAMITNEGIGLKEIQNIVENSILKVNKDVSLFSWHNATVDEAGLVVQVINGGDSAARDGFDIKWHE